jgi:hypothetical protein
VRTVGLVEPVQVTSWLVASTDRQRKRQATSHWTVGRPGEAGFRRTGAKADVRRGAASPFRVGRCSVSDVWLIRVLFRDGSQRTIGLARRLDVGRGPDAAVLRSQDEHPRCLSPVVPSRRCPCCLDFGRLRWIRYLVSKPAARPTQCALLIVFPYQTTYDISCGIRSNDRFYPH